MCCLMNHRTGTNPCSPPQISLITPHLSWYSIGSLEKMRLEAAGSIAQLVQGQPPSGLLNPSAFDSGRWVRGKSLGVRALVFSATQRIQLENVDDPVCGCE